MTKRMLIDTSHREETRVVVHENNRLEDFDYETLARKQLKGNIYLAQVTRVEPSLQAAFVEYGGNRHGFLPFSEIHPDYYRIPLADREALEAAMNATASLSGAAYSDDEQAAGTKSAQRKAPEGKKAAPESVIAKGSEEEKSEALAKDASPEAAGENETQASEGNAVDTIKQDAAETAGDGRHAVHSVALDSLEQDDTIEELAGESSVDSISDEGENESDDCREEETDDEEHRRQIRRLRFLRHYKIQEVIRRKQVLLVQVTKEERGNKGATLTTYLSLAGRYSVLMPNTNKGGGISRKISGPNDRKRLKEILSELKIPEGIAVIVRTAGSQRSKLEIRRDYEYLIRLWNDIRATTLESEAPCLIYEEADLIRRAIRDLYTSDMEEILVEGEKGYRAAKSFMRTLIPSHAKKVRQYKEMQIPLLHRYQVEGQIDAMHNPTVKLKSGGYIVINPTEALVSIDVNSGRATKERHIEETAFKTNLEAAEEVARQLRLRDLAGLIVIDFIDMDDNKRNREVERRLKEAMSADRARIQMGRISPFGLLEMSRQRLRPSLMENSTVICPHCGGIGSIRTIESAALRALRVLEEDAIRRSGGVIVLSVPNEIALYLLNQKRHRVNDIEQRYSLSIAVRADDSYRVDQHNLERVNSRNGGSKADLTPLEEATKEPEDRKQSESRHNDKRRRRKERRDDEEGDHLDSLQGDNSNLSDEDDDSDESNDLGHDQKRRRRGKRGGRRRGRRSEDSNRSDDEQGQDSADGNKTRSPAEDTTEAGERGRGKGIKRPRSVKGRNRKLLNKTDDDPGNAAPEDRGKNSRGDENSGTDESPPSEKGEDPPVSPQKKLDATTTEGEETTPRVRRKGPSTEGKKATTPRKPRTPRSPLGRRRHKSDNDERNEKERKGTEVADQAHQDVAVAPASLSKAKASEVKKAAPKAERPTAEAMPRLDTPGPVPLAAPADEGVAVAAAKAETDKSRPRRNGWWNRD